MKYLLETQQRLLALCGQKTFSPGDIIPYSVIQMRKRLIMEETHELIDAIDAMIVRDWHPNKEYSELRAHFLKEFADTLVVLFGTAAQLGFTSEELEEAYDIVHMDNMGKAYMYELDAELARDWYYRNHPGDFHVKAITMPPVSASITIKGDGELAVEPIPLTYYVVTNEDGKIMKRYPAPATTAEERILQYVTKENTSQNTK